MAETHLETAEEILTRLGGMGVQREELLALAQVEATLALRDAVAQVKDALDDIAARPPS